jgi:hypothetical protein
MFNFHFLGPVRTSQAIQHLSMMSVAVCIILAVLEVNFIDGAPMTADISLQQQRHHRVLQPCGVRFPAATSPPLDDDLPPQELDELDENYAVEDELHYEDAYEDDVKTRIQWSIKRIGETLWRLCHAVEQFKHRYCTQRGLTDVTITGLHVKGMPLYPDINIGDNFTDTVALTETLADVTNKLSWVAIFLELLQAEESAEPVPFVDDILRLENDREHGLYAVLCHLRIAHLRAARVAEQQAEATWQLMDADSASASFPMLPEVTSPIDRHVRGYSILHDIAELLRYQAERLERIHGTA